MSVYARANARGPQRPELQDNFSAIVDFPGGRYAVISQTLSAFEHHQVAKLTGSQGALWAGWSGAMDRTFHPTFFLKHFDGQQVTDVPISAASGEVYELAEEIAGMAESVVRGVHAAVAEDARTWLVRLEGGDDVKAEVAREVVASGAGLVEMTRQAASLEEVFLKLVTEEAAA